MGKRGRTWRSRVLWIPALALLLVAGAAALVLGPRWGAIQVLRCLGAPQPKLKELPGGIELVQGPQALGFKRALIARPDAKGPRPVVVFITGIIDEHGVENPRVVQGADAFRQAGHIVFVPEVAMYVDPGQPTDDLGMVVQSLRRVAAGEIDGSREQAFALIGLSLGGGLALRALADFRRDGGRGCRAALAVGAPGNLYAEAQRWFEIPLPEDKVPPGLQLERRKAAAFARSVLYRAALPTLIKNDSDRAIIKQWLDKKWMPKKGPEGLVSPRAQALAKSFLGGIPAWKADREEILRHAWGRMRHSSPVEWRQRFSDLAGVPMFLLHGIDDPLISIASVGHLEMFLSRETMTVALRSTLVGHVDIADVSLHEKLRNVAFLDDFFDMVGG